MLIHHQMSDHTYFNTMFSEQQEVMWAFTLTCYGHDPEVTVVAHLELKCGFCTREMSKPSRTLE